MNDQDISTLLGCDLLDVQLWTDGKVVPTTLEEARGLLYRCPAEMQDVVAEQWIELCKQALSVIKTPKEAKKMYRDHSLINEWSVCESMRYAIGEIKNAIIEKWTELCKQALSSIATSQEAWELYNLCPAVTLVRQEEELYFIYTFGLKSDIARRWLEIKIPTLTTLHRAREALHNCPSEARPVIMERWTELCKQALSVIKTTQEARRLVFNCPTEMRDAVAERWKELIVPTTPREAYAMYNECFYSKEGVFAELSNAARKRWIELCEKALQTITTPEDARVLYQYCPKDMRPELIRRLKEW